MANAANIICVIFAVSLSSQTSIPLGSAAVTQVSDPKENSCVLTYHIQDYIFTPRWGSVLYSNLPDFYISAYLCCVVTLAVLLILMSHVQVGFVVISTAVFLFVHRVY